MGQTNVQECKECGELFVTFAFEEMRSPGKYPLGICKACSQHEYEGHGYTEPEKENDDLEEGEP